MASVRAVLYDVEQNCISAGAICSMELSRDIDAACDGLRISFDSREALPELVSIMLYFGDRLLFNGYVDTQREQLSENGFECFIYARSSACLLTDDASEPTTYYMPSVDALFKKNADSFGFENCLANYCSQGEYIVNNGVSRYGAINDFVYALTGKSIMITPDNRLKLIEAQNDIFISKKDVISQKRVINRGQAISRIDYKIDSNASYRHHIKSESLSQKGITNSLVKNVSAVPNWQKDNLVKNAIKKANEDYYCLELLVCGLPEVELDSLVGTDCDFAIGEKWHVKSVKHYLDEKGLFTRLALFSEIDLGEIMYVD